MIDILARASGTAVTHGRVIPSHKRHHDRLLTTRPLRFSIYGKCHSVRTGPDSVKSPRLQPAILLGPAGLIATVFSLEAASVSASQLIHVVVAGNVVGAFHPEHVASRRTKPPAVIDLLRIEVRCGAVRTL